MMNPNQTPSKETLVRDEEVEELVKALPKATTISNKFQIVKYQDFWHPTIVLKSILEFQRHFKPRDTDLIIASHPKTGTTWLKALLFAIVNRGNNHKNTSTNQSPLLANHPHELVYRLEYDIYGDGSGFPYPRPHHLTELPSPRLLSTHLPYPSLPQSIHASKCRILYIARNPLDTCVSHWHYFTKAIKKIVGDDDEDFQPPSIEDYFEDFYQGRIVNGPFFEHVVGYWNQSLEQPNKVLFIKYEDLMDEGKAEVKRLAEFVGLPFSPEEESEGVIEEIIKLCSIENLKGLEVNKSGVINNFFAKQDYFRKGEVGDWTRYFNPSIEERVDKLMQEKLSGTGLFFKLRS